MPTLIRCEQKLFIAILALTMGPAMVFGLSGLGLLLLLQLGGVDGIVFGLLLIGVGCFIAYQMAENFAWVELNDRSLRAQRFWTRTVIEHEIDEITKVIPLVSAVTNLESLLTDALMSRLLETTNRGFFIEFSKGPRLALIRGDMTHIDEFIVLLRDQLGDARWNEVLRLPDAKS